MSESITEPELSPEPVPTATATVIPTAASARGEAPAQVEAPARLETPARLEAPARIVPQACCAACAGEDSATEFAYAVGRLSVEFPDPSVRAEVDAQAKELGVLNTSTADYRVLSQRANGSAELSNLYLAKLARWVLAVDGVPTFSLYPRSTVELEELVAALAPQGLEDRLLVAIGPTMTGDGTDVGVLVNKVYYGSLQEHIARLGQITDADTVKTMFSVLQVESVPGDADEQRAKNFLAFRSREIYRKATDLARGDRPKRLVGAKVEPSKVAGSREILDVRFQFKDDDGEESQWRVGVDVGGQFPFMTSKLVPFYG